jgi:hypothetical protein
MPRGQPDLTSVKNCKKVLIVESWVHPLGTFGYDYSNEFPGYLAGLGIMGGLLGLRTALVSRRNSRSERTSTYRSGHNLTNG